MHLDVHDLRNFYYRRALGRATQRVVRNTIQEFWPEAQKQTVAGVGFAVPLLRPYLSSARRVIGLMPGPQGVMHWPAGQPNVTTLCEDTQWPLQTGQVDKLVVMHGLETTETPTEFLDECYRVLGPGGSAIFIVPNRAGLWARSDQTPFGFGRPYSLTQLEAQLKSHGLTPERHVSALYQPPSEKRTWMKFGAAIERLGRKMPSIYAGGVLIVEVSKQIPAPKRPGLAQAVRKPLTILDGLTNPVPKPAMRRPTKQS